MELIVYSQSSGFESVEVPFEARAAGEEFGAWAKRIGFDGLYALGVGPGNTGLLYARDAAGHGWFALVQLEVGDQQFLVLVRTEADLLALTIAIAPLFQANTRTLERVESIIAKAFQAWHGHDAYESCRDCDPVGVETDRRERQQAAGSTDK